MWSEILGGVLKNGTTTPAQIQPDKTDQATTIALILLGVIVVLVIGFVSFKLFSK